MRENVEDQALEALLSFLKASNGFDFTAYKRSNLRRRIEKRMQAVDIDGLGHYRAFLEANPEEFVPLFNTILINVSSFFRDSETWNFVKTRVIPDVLASKPADSSIRAWSAACAGGQEPYTLAMVLAEIMGVENYCRRVKIYATDLDEEALDRARRARYDSHALKSVPDELRAKYFQNDEDAFVFHGGLRRSVIFGRHDLVEDRPVSHVDLLFCRNALMYFNVNAQARVLARLHDALNEAGFLIVGRAEMLLSQPQMFAPIDIQHGVFSRVRKPSDSRELSGADAESRQLRATEEELESAWGKLEAQSVELARAAEKLNDVKRELRRVQGLLGAILTSLPVGIMVVDAELRVQLWNDRASEMWGIGAIAAVGGSLLELDIGLPVAKLEHAIRACIDGGETVRHVVVDAADRRGKNFRCHVTVTALNHDEVMLRGAVLLTDEWTQSRE